MNLFPELRAFAHALRNATVDGKAQPFPSQRQHAEYVADVWRYLAPDYPAVGAWFVAEAMPRWVVGTRHESAWDRAAAKALDELVEAAEDEDAVAKSVTNR